MTIDTRWLRERNACPMGVRLFSHLFPNAADGVEVNEANLLRVMKHSASCGMWFVSELIGWAEEDRVYYGADRDRESGKVFVNSYAGRAIRAIQRAGEAVNAT